MRASSRADSVAKRRSRINSGSAALRSVSQWVSTRSTMRRRSRAAPPTVSTKPISWLTSSAISERGEGRFRQAGADQQRLQAGAAAVVQQRGDARLRQAGQFGQRASNSSRLPDSSARRIKPGGELAGGAQMPHQAAHVLAARTRRDVDGGALARLAGDAPCPVGAQPVPGDDELRQRVGEFCDQRHARRGRQIFQHQHRFPDRGEMAVTLDDAVPGERRQFRIRHFRSVRARPRREPTSAIAAQTEAGRLMRRAMAHCISPLPVATMSTRSASIRSGECSSTGSATEGWSSDSACTMAAGASALRANTSAIAWRTSGDGSSSSISSAPSAAARSSSERSEISQARASDRVASARSPAGAVRIQLMNCRTIMVLPAYAT